MDDRWYRRGGIVDDPDCAEDTVGVGVDHRARRVGARPTWLGFELGIGRRRLDTLQHIDHDDGHVVTTTVGIGLGDQLVGGGLGVAGRQGDGGDVVVVNLVDEPVTAQDETVAVNHRHQPGVDPHCGLDAEGARHDVASRVRARLVLADVAGVDQLLHVAVVDRGAVQHAVAQQVGA